MAPRNVERVVIALVDEDNDENLEDEARRCFVVIESMILSQNHRIEGNLKDIPIEKKIAKCLCLKKRKNCTSCD